MLVDGADQFGQRPHRARAVIGQWRDRLVDGRRGPDGRRGQRTQVLLGFALHAAEHLGQLLELRNRVRHVTW
jgi:hypothetical protein